VGPPQHLETTPGLHRFVWDLRLPRPQALSYEYSIAAIWQVGTPLEPRGPLVLPGRYSVTLTVGGKAYTAPLLVRLDPRVRVTQAALRSQLAFVQAMDSALDTAVAAHRAVARVLERKDALEPAMADSLRSLDSSRPGFSSTAGTLASLITTVQGADGAPTQGDRAAFAECRRDLDQLLARWRRVRATISESLTGN